MSRKQHHASAKPRNTVPRAASLLSLAETDYRGGRLREADALYARFLASEPRHARALHMRGLIARQQRRLDDAVAHFAHALSFAPGVAAIHEGLAETYRTAARPVEAERHYRRVAELQPGAVPLLNLGNALMELQRPGDAAEMYKSALRRDGRLPEAYYGLGTALAALGILEAGAAFARAAGLRPDLALAHEGLIDACIATGAWGAALQACCQALLRADTPRLRLQFVDSVVNVNLTAEVPGLREAMLRALVERWSRPQDLAGAACAMVALRLPFDTSDTLLRTLLELAPICHRGIEQALTEQRWVLLQAAASGTVLPAEAMQAACGLARQCFVNEYAWHCLPAESSQIDALRRAIERDLDCGLVLSDTVVVTAAMYLPLASLDGAERLLSQRRPLPLAAVLAQQISEPAEEHRLGGIIPRATAIEDEVSRAVRAQYEQNPYPRWVATIAAARPARLGDWLAGRFPGAPLTPLANGKTLDVLVAGCGTGQQAIETVRGLADARVLAIDLSLASLAYAARMSTELGAAGIEYAQADLLAAEQLGRSFDMISVGGVLHHLADPWAGWRTLLGLLRPGGVMNVLLYTMRGRNDVRRAREWIAESGYPATAEGIRSCRHELMALPDDWARRLSASPDCCSVSGCRDLLFHVQEQAVTLPQVSGFLASAGLDLLGIEVPPATKQVFQVWNGGMSDDSMRDLERWDRFEAEYPRCFASMLNLWVQKPFRSPA